MHAHDVKGGPPRKLGDGCTPEARHVRDSLALDHLKGQMD
jgi:hypothetical protein